MKKLSSSLPNMIVVLVAVALITGGTLAYVHKITEAPIARQNVESLATDIQKVMGGQKVTVVGDVKLKKNIDGKDFDFVVHKVKTADGMTTGCAVESSVMGFGGTLGVLVGFDSKGNITGYTIRQSSETPGLGQKADAWFQKGEKGSVVGLNPDKCKFTVSKDGGDIDGITASTITSRAFLNAVRQAYDVMRDVTADGATAPKKESVASSK